MTEKTWINTQVEIELDIAIRRIAAEYRKTRSEIIRQALEEFIASQDKVISVGELARPTGGQHVPVVTVIPNKNQ